MDSVVVRQGRGVRFVLRRALIQSVDRMDGMDRMHLAEHEDLPSEVEARYRDQHSTSNYPPALRCEGVVTTPSGTFCPT